MDNIAVKVENVSKEFLLPHERKNSLKERVLSFRKPTFERMHALRNIDFEVKRGEFFGIVGRNGSGKSTLLKIIGGIYQPTKGGVTVNGTLTPFIELGIGFNPELTGRENVFLNGAILGLTRKEIVAKYDEIVEFAELSKFMDQKLKNYSSGMQVRLAFSIAIQAHNDILLIDEVLAVGDTSFQRKCYRVFQDIKNSGKTVIFVTHDMGAVQKFCDRALMIQDSKVVALGEPREIALRYELANTESVGREEATTFERPKNPSIKIESVKLFAKNKASKQFTVKDDIVAEIVLNARRPEPIQANLYFVRADGSYLGGINSTMHLGQDFTPQKGVNKLRCTIKAGQLIKGDYGVGIAVYTPGYVPDLIDIVDKNYSAKDMPNISIIDASTYQDGEFYIQGSWSKTGKS